MKINAYKISFLQASQGKTQSQIADDAGITRATMSIALKRGSARPDTIYKIAKALNVDPLEIVKIEVQP